MAVFNGKDREPVYAPGAFDPASVIDIAQAMIRGRKSPDELAREELAAKVEDKLWYAEVQAKSGKRPSDLEAVLEDNKDRANFIALVADQEETELARALAEVKKNLSALPNEPGSAEAFWDSFNNGGDTVRRLKLGANDTEDFAGKLYDADPEFAQRIAEGLLAVRAKRQQG